MSNKKITDLPELTNPTTDDVFPIVDIATNTTLKVQVGNLPIQTAVATALATKQDNLVSGTNIKTINSATLLDAGDIVLQTPLVSGTNIKTINGVTVLGSGNIPVVTSPSGVSGAIQFSNGSAFASDASNLFWDDTNNRLGVGTNTPSSTMHIRTQNSTANGILINSQDACGITITGDEYPNSLTISKSTSQFRIDTNGFLNISSGAGLTISKPTIQGSGSTSATTSLLVQDSNSLQCFRVRDDGQVALGNSSNFIVDAATGPTYNRFELAVGGLSSVPSAILSATSTTRGFLPPRMTTTQKNAISSPAAGLVVYDSTTNKLCCYNGSTWNDLF
jgi:hypothetical protein